MISSKDPNFDWHSNAGGLWVARDARGEPLCSSCSLTPHSSRAILLRNKNKPWSTLVELGWAIVKYEVAQ